MPQAGQSGFQPRFLSHWSGLEAPPTQAGYGLQATVFSHPSPVTRHPFTMQAASVSDGDPCEHAAN